jgi:hypothetical protein
MNKIQSSDDRKTTRLMRKLTEKERDMLRTRNRRTKRLIQSHTNSAR